MLVFVRKDNGVRLELQASSLWGCSIIWGQEHLYVKFKPFSICCKKKEKEQMFISLFGKAHEQGITRLRGSPFLHHCQMNSVKLTFQRNLPLNDQLCSDSMHACIIESSMLTKFPARLHHQMADTDPQFGNHISPANVRKLFRLLSAFPAMLSSSLPSVLSPQNVWCWSGRLLNKWGFFQCAWQRCPQGEKPITWPALVFCLAV